MRRELAALQRGVGLEPEIIAVAAVLFLSTLFRSTFGFGDAMVALPLLWMFVDVQFARPLIAAVSVVIAAMIVLTDWRRIQWRSALWLIGWSLPGIPLGHFALQWFDERIVKLVLGAVVVGFAAFQLTRRRHTTLTSDRSAWLFGLTAGTLGGAYNIPGPALVIFGALRGWTAEQFRASLQGYFLPVSAAIVATHLAAGMWTAAVTTHFLWALPLILAAIWCGGRLNRWLGRRDFTRYVYGMLIVLGGGLVVQAVVG